MRSVLAAICAVAAVSPSVASAQAAASPGRLLVISKAKSMVEVIDPVAMVVVGEVPSGPQPHEVAASADGRLAYVSNYGMGRGGPGLSTLTVGDLVGFKALPPVELGALRGPHGVIQSGGKIYFTAEANKVIGRYDPASRTVDWVLGTGQDGTHMLLASSDQRRLFTTNIQSGSVSVIEHEPNRPGRYISAPENDWLVTDIKIGAPAEEFEGFDVAPDGRELWAASPTGRIVVVDTVGKKVVESISVPAITGANRLQFTPDGKKVLISRLIDLKGQSGGNVVVFDPVTHKEIKQIVTGGGGGGILIQPDGARAYIAGPDSVIVLDMKTLDVVGRIPIDRPDGMAWAVAP